MLNEAEIGNGVKQNVSIQSNESLQDKRKRYTLVENIPRHSPLFPNISPKWMASFNSMIG